MLLSKQAYKCRAEQQKHLKTECNLFFGVNCNHEIGAFEVGLLAPLSPFFLHKDNYTLQEDEVSSKQGIPAEVA